MIVGQFYKVPAVRVLDWHGFQGWLPVIGPKHEDAEFINFPWDHFHIDWRFVSHRLFKFMAGVRGPSFVYAAPIQCPDRHGNKAILQGPELRRMKCKRESPPYPMEAVRNRWLPALSAKYACAKLTKGVCPHRGIPVEAMIRDGDILTCPGHGLQWNAITGHAHTSRGAIMTAEEFGATAAAKYADTLRLPVNSDERRLLEGAFAHAWQSGYVVGVDAAKEVMLTAFAQGRLSHNGAKS